MINEVDIDEIMEIAMNCSKSKDHELLHTNELQEIQIDGRQSGFVLKAIAITNVCLRKNYSYEEALTNVIASGGDADTNAAIVGAVLGAKYGFKKIPENLSKYLFNGSWIYKDFAQMLASMGINPPMSPYDKLAYE